MPRGGTPLRSGPDSRTSALNGSLVTSARSGAAATIATPTASSRSTPLLSESRRGEMAPVRSWRTELIEAHRIVARAYEREADRFIEDDPDRPGINET